MSPLNFGGKSKEEKDIEREMRYRKARAKLQQYIERIDDLQKMVYNQGKQAAKLGDDKFVRRQASKYLALHDKSKRGQRMLLLMEEARLQREMVKISGDFITFARDISQSIAEGPNVKQIASSQLQFEKAITQSEKMDEALSMALDMASEGVLGSGDYSDKGVDEVVKTMQGEVETEEKSLDDRITKGIKDVEDMMKKGS
jgi:hypothetical protein